MKKLQDFKEQLFEKLVDAKQRYHYQPLLTKKLDAHNGDFSEQTLLEIVLWKVNRYPIIPDNLLVAINDLRKSYNEEKAREILRELLRRENKGFDLPMASTVLRFACPEHLQIIDQRVYRLITPGVDKLKLPQNSEEKIHMYFDYIARLKEICQVYGIEFRMADRILYQLDKMENKNVPIH